MNSFLVFCINSSAMKTRFILKYLTTFLELALSRRVALKHYHSTFHMAIIIIIIFVIITIIVVVVIIITISVINRLVFLRITSIVYCLSNKQDVPAKVAMLFLSNFVINAKNIGINNNNIVMKLLFRHN